MAMSVPSVDVNTVRIVSITLTVRLKTDWRSALSLSAFQLNRSRNANRPIFGTEMFAPNSTGALASPLTIGRTWGWLTLTIRSGAVAAVFDVQNADPQTLDELMAIPSDEAPE
jgi:hypothetical protein